MRKSIIFGMLWIGLLFGGAIFLGLNFNALQISNYGVRSIKIPTAEQRAQLKKIYDVNFIMQKAPSGSIANYLPRQEFIDDAIVKSLSEAFGITRNFEETDKAYFFENEEGRLIIDKFGAHLRFESTADANSGNISDDEASKSAAEFMAKRIPGFYYEETIQSRRTGEIEITFINRLGNLKDFAFPNKVTLDEAGNVLTVDFYFYLYDKMDNFPIKSMSDAFYELPADLEHKVDLKKCSLVYYYQDSIVQPCYLFEGETSAGENRKFFVSATNFYKNH